MASTSTTPATSTTWFNRLEYARSRQNNFEGDRPFNDAQHIIRCRGHYCRFQNQIGLNAHGEQGTCYAVYTFSHYSCSLEPFDHIHLHKRRLNPSKKFAMGPYMINNPSQNCAVFFGNYSNPNLDLDTMMFFDGIHNLVPRYHEERRRSSSVGVQTRGQQQQEMRRRPASVDRWTYSRTQSNVQYRGNYTAGSQQRREFSSSSRRGHWPASRQEQQLPGNRPREHRHGLGQGRGQVRGKEQGRGQGPNQYKEQGRGQGPNLYRRQIRDGSERRNSTGERPASSAGQQPTSEAEKKIKRILKPVKNACRERDVKSEDRSQSPTSQLIIDLNNNEATGRSDLAIVLPPLPSYNNEGRLQPSTLDQLAINRNDPQSKSNSATPTRAQDTEEVKKCANLINIVRQRCEFIGTDFKTLVDTLLCTDPEATVGMKAWESKTLPPQYNKDFDACDKGMLEKGLEQYELRDPIRQQLEESTEYHTADPTYWKSIKAIAVKKHRGINNTDEKHSENTSIIGESLSVKGLDMKKESLELECKGTQIDNQVLAQKDEENMDMKNKDLLKSLAKIEKTGKFAFEMEKANFHARVSALEDLQKTINEFSPGRAEVTVPAAIKITPARVLDS